MKKISMIALLLAGLTQIHAQEREAPFTYHLGLHFGKNYTDSSSKMRDNALYGIRTTVMLTPFYGLSLGYDRMESIDIKESPDTIDAQRYYMQIEVDGEEQYHTVPYITLGVGYEDLSKDIYVRDETTGKSNKYDVSQLYISGGLGFRYNFIPELSLYAEGNVLYKTDTTDVDYNLLAGLQYHINATTCDKTYVTDRLREKPQEQTVLHTGPVNVYSTWEKAHPPRSAVKATGSGKSAGMKRTHRKAKAQKAAAKRRHHLTHRRADHTPRKGDATGGGYYVVLGAYKTEKALNTQIRRLERAKIPYLLRDSSRKGMTYVLSGAYPTRSKAVHALKRLKKIQRDAYIAKMK